MITNRLPIIFFLTSILLISVLQGVSADRNDATEQTILIDTDEESVEYLSTEMGIPVEIWIDSIDGANNDLGHPIDVYIVTSDQRWDHFCGGEGNQFADEFTPVYVREKLDLTSGNTWYLEWTPQTDDYYMIMFDNCDNQRTSDYKADVSSVIVTYAVDDQSDEGAEGILAFLGASILICCGIPLLLAVMALFLLFMLTISGFLGARKKEVIVIQQQPSNLGNQPPPSN